MKFGQISLSSLWFEKQHLIHLRSYLINITLLSYICASCKTSTRIYFYRIVDALFFPKSPDRLLISSNRFILHQIKISIHLITEERQAKINKEIHRNIKFRYLGDYAVVLSILAVFRFI